MSLDLNRSNAKFLKFDPSPEDSDSTVTEYVSRTQALLPNDREKVAVELPATFVIESIENMKLQLERHDRELEQLRQEIDSNRQPKLNLYVANLLKKVLEKVLRIRGISMPQGENDPMHGRYSQAIKLITREKWEKDTNLPVKYWNVLQNLPEFTNLENENAHESESDFARLLLSYTFYQKQEYYFWGNLLVFVYGESVEELAQRESPNDLAKILMKKYDEQMED